MKAKKPAVKTAKKSVKKSAKKSGKKSAKKSGKKSAKKSVSESVKKLSCRVKICEACMNIRNGITNSPATSQGNFVPHTCGKTDQQLREFIFNMNLLNGMRRRLPYGSEFDDC